MVKKLNEKKIKGMIKEQITNLLKENASVNPEQTHQNADQENLIQQASEYTFQNILASQVIKTMQGLMQNNANALKKINQSGKLNDVDAQRAASMAYDKYNQSYGQTYGYVENPFM